MTILFSPPPYRFWRRCRFYAEVSDSREVCGTPDAGSCGYRLLLQNVLDRMQRIALCEHRERTHANRMKQ